MSNYSRNGNNDSQTSCGLCFYELDSIMSMKIQEERIKRVFEDSEVINVGEIFGGEKICVIRRGQIDFLLSDEEGRTIVLMKFTENDRGIILPEELFSSFTANVIAVSVGKTEICYIPEYLSRELCRQNVRVNQRQRECYSLLFSNLISLVNDLSFLSLKDRLLKEIEEHCCLYHTDTIMITHEHLAAELGTSREVITRLLKKLEEEGYIIVRRKCIQMCHTDSGGAVKKRVETSSF